MNGVFVVIWPNDQAHRRQWSVAELPSGAAPCYVHFLTGEIMFWP